MKLIIAGSRDITDYEILLKALQYAKIMTTKVDAVVSGRAKGVDSLGEIWARQNSILVIPFKANWSDLTTPPVYIKKGRNGPYNALAGFNRNQRMADYADALLAIIKDDSPGTRDMIERMQKAQKDVTVYEV